MAMRFTRCISAYSSREIHKLLLRFAGRSVYCTWLFIDDVALFVCSYPFLSFLIWLKVIRRGRSFPTKCVTAYPHRHRPLLLILVNFGDLSWAFDELFVTLWLIVV